LTLKTDGAIVHVIAYPLKVRKLLFVNAPLFPIFTIPSLYPRVFENSVQRCASKVQSTPLVCPPFQVSYYPKRLGVTLITIQVVARISHKFIEASLPFMSEWRVTEIVGETSSLDDIRV
jgi:hypothetical protein